MTTRECAGRGKALIATNTPNQDHYDVVLSVHSDWIFLIISAGFSQISVSVL